MEVDEPAELVGKYWPDILQPQWRGPATEAIERASAGLPTRFNVDSITLKGNLRTFDTCVGPLYGAGGGVTRVLVHKIQLNSASVDLDAARDDKDVALAVLTQQLDLQSRQLAEASLLATHSEKLRVMGQFVGDIVHDINNVLTVINGASRMLTNGAESPAQAEILAGVDRAIERGAHLTRQLLNLSRIDDADPTVIELDECFDETGKLIGLLLGSDITLTLDIPQGCWPVLVRPGRLQAVLLNLCANARDAMPDGGSLTIKIANCYSNERPRALASGDYVQIAIRDSGVGMSPEVRAKAGQAFFTTKGFGKGTGLGLASAFDFARQCRGQVSIDTELGVGTTINLYLPRAAAEGQAVMKMDSAVDPKSHGDATILLVENEDMTRFHLAAMLRLLNYHVVEAARADVAYAMLTGGVAVDLACIDLQLDQGSGLQLARRLRERLPNLPVIFMTGSSGMAPPANELVFRKPIAESALARAILERLGRRPALLLTAEALRLSDRLRDKIRHPRVRAAFDRWRSLAERETRVPQLSDALALAPQMLENACLMRIETADDSAASFRVISAGRMLIERLGRDLTGELISAPDDDVLGSIGSAYRRALAGVAYFDYARFPLNDGTITLFERLILPLSEDGERISHLFGLITFDELTEHSQDKCHV